MKENFLSKHLSQKGFGIVQSLIAAGMMGGVAYLYATIQKNASESQNLYRYQMLRNEMRGSLASYLQQQSKSCSCTLQNYEFNPTSLPSKIDIGSPGLQIMGEVSPCGTAIRTVMSKGMQIENAIVQEMSLVVLNGSGDNFTGELRIQLAPLGKVPKFAARDIVMPIDFSTVDSGANKQISECMKSSAPSGGAISFDANEIGDSTTPVTKSWNLSKVPPEAKAVTIRWLIGNVSGSGKGDREDRNCAIANNNGVTYRIGYQSYGDGEAHYIAGTSVIRLGSYPHQLNISCVNPGGQGYLTVDGVIY